MALSRGNALERKSTACVCAIVTVLEAEGCPSAIGSTRHSSSAAGGQVVCAVMEVVEKVLTELRNNQVQHQATGACLHGLTALQGRVF